MTPAMLALIQAATEVAAAPATSVPHPGAIALIADVVGARLVEWAIGGVGVIVVARTLIVLSAKVDACATKDSVATVRDQFATGVNDVRLQLSSFESTMKALIVGPSGENGIAGRLTAVERRTGKVEQRTATVEARLDLHLSPGGRRADDH